MKGHKKRKEEVLYQIDVLYACGGILVKKNKKGCLVVVEAAPIFRWMLRKSLVEIKSWIKRKRGSIVKL